MNVYKCEISCGRVSERVRREQKSCKTSLYYREVKMKK